MKTEYVTYYDNACQKPSRSVVRRHRSAEAAESFCRRKNGKIRGDGYTHGYGSAGLRDFEEVEIGDDIDDLDIVVMLDTGYGKWFKID